MGGIDMARRVALCVLCMCTSWIAAAAFAPVCRSAGVTVVARAVARKSIICASAGPHSATPASSPRVHVVSGLLCTEVPISLNVNIDCGLGVLRKRIDVTVLEASSASQDALVNSALLLEGDDKTNSVTLTSGDPYGAVLWPAGAAVAEYLFGEAGVSQSTLESQTFLELGAGTGLLSLAAACAGHARVISTDYESLTLDFLAHAAEHLNARVPPGVISTAVLDFCDPATRLPAAHIVVAADVLYMPAAGPPLARRVLEALEAGSRVVVGDSPDRPGRASFSRELAALLPGVRVAEQWVEVEGRACAGHRHELICGAGSKSVSSRQASVTVSILDLRPSCLHARADMAIAP